MSHCSGCTVSLLKKDATRNTTIVFTINDDNHRKDTPTKAMTMNLEYGPIVRRGVTTVSDDDKIQLTIYYKNRKVNIIIMKNSPMECDKDISRVGVIYQ